MNCMPDQSEPKQPDAAELTGTPSSGTESAGTSMVKNPDNPGGPIDATTPSESATDRPTEIGGQKGLEPTRYGDWEKNGRCTDF